MANGQATLHRVLTFQDMDIGAADRGGGHAHQGIVGADFRNRFIVNFDTAGFNEDGRFHHGRHGSLPQ